MTVRDAAAQYIARGWQVVPLEPRGKACLHKVWQGRDYSPEEFAPEHNIGIQSTKGLVDVDNDCPEAVLFAQAFLPKTNAVYGRLSRPKSHWLYRSQIDNPLAFKDPIAQKVLCEIRVKHQSMAPPSVHPNGESITWEYPTFEEADVDPKFLLRSVRLVATGCMIARYYNPPGARHEWGVALSGFLRRLSVTEIEAVKLFELAATWAKDDKVKDRLDAVRSTYGLNEETPTTGATKLAEFIGEQGKEFTTALYKIWGEESGGVSQSRLEKMNTKHAVLFNQGGKVCILTEVTEDGMPQVRFTNRHEFELLYPQKVQVGVTDAGKPIMTSLAKAWLEHPKRRFYQGIELAPGNDPNPGYYNLWKGFSVEPKRGDWSLFRQHIDLLVQQDADHANYVLDWMAEAVQRPHQQIGIALAFKGGQGVGKSTFARWFGALFGPHFLHLDSEHRLLGQFNSHLHNAIVVLADEAVWAGGKVGLGALKRMITEPTLAIERKGLDVINVKNMLHMIIASNEDWFVPTGFDNRRFAIFEVSDTKQNNGAFFGAVRKQLYEQGGLAALLYDMLERKRTIDLRRIPETEELERQKKWSMSARHQWWHEQLLSGDPWKGAIALPADGEGETYYEVDPEPIYAGYVVAIRQADHRMNAGLMGAVGRFLRTVMPDNCPTTLQHDRKRFWVIPSLSSCRAYFDKVTRSRTDWPDDPDALKPREVPF